MKDVIEYLFKSIVTDDAKVQVEETETTEEDAVVFSVTVPKEEMGKVIGSGGAVIKSIRLLASIVARREGKRLRIDLVEG